MARRKSPTHTKKFRGGQKQNIRIKLTKFIEGIKVKKNDGYVLNTRLFDSQVLYIHRQFIYLYVAEIFFSSV